MVQNCFTSLRWSVLLLLFMISSFSSMGQCLMVPATLESRVDASSLIVEAKVVRQHATWNKSNNMIYTTHELEVYKVFKGTVNTSTVVIATEGGVVGMDKIEVNPELKLNIGQTGIFTLKSSSVDLKLRSPLYTAVEATQGFIKYNKTFDKATGVFESYDDIPDELYRPIQQFTNMAIVEKRQLPVLNSTQGVSRMVPVISGFNPTTVTAGTKTTITITGTGFGAIQGTGEVSFSDANAASGYLQPLASEYVSWSDTEIIVEVMSGAGTGKIQVSDGTTTTTSAADLTVTYNISNVENGGNTYTSIHANDNSFGGYTFQYHTEIAAVPGATEDMESALDTWACETGINWRIGFNTTTDASVNDGINIIRFDNGAELPASTIGRCRTYSSGCTTMGVTTWYVSELDMTFNDDYTFHYGAGLPGGSEMDFLSIALHELGHGHQLGHVINSSMIMHYSIGAGDQKRTLASDEIDAGIYMSGLSTTNSHCNRPSMEANGCGIAPLALFNAGAAASCAGNLTFDFFDVSENLPTSWAWDVDGDGNTDYTTRNPSHTYASAGNYTVMLTATNSSGSNSYTSSVAVGTTPMAACTVSTTNTGNFGTGVDGFVFNTIQNNHIDSDNDDTQDFTCDHSTVLVTEGSYPFTVNLRGGNLEFCHIYIDYNNDGSFNTTDELAYNGSTPQAVHTGTITIPATATTQTSLRLRVVTDITAAPTPCGPTLHGEAEDYGVYILCGLPVPDVATLMDVTEECTAALTAPTATDPCDASTITGSTTDPVTYSNEGTYTVTWTYTGISGSVTQTQTVIIDDTEAPVPDAAMLSDLTDECEVTVTTTPTATDACEGAITATTTDPLFYNTQGTFMITWTYDDGNGNPATQTQTVIVDDVTAPVPDLANLPDITDECMATATPPQATDNCDGPIFGTTTDPTTFTTQGTHTVNWTFTDAEGNTDAQIQTVIIDDITDPIISCAPDVTENADANCQFTLPDYTGNVTLLSDACSAAITVTQSPTIGTVITGTTAITLTADDGNGNSSTCTFNVLIDDTVAPTVVTRDITVSLDGNGNATITAADLDNGSNDNCSGITFSASQTVFDCSNLGDNTVSLTATDANSNAASENATVTIVDDLAPVADVANLADVTGTCLATATAPTATDNCDGTVTATTTDPTTYSIEGTYTITWTYTDGSGNISTQMQMVIVDDVNPPTIVADADITVSANAACEFTLLDYTSNHTTLTDDCSASITVTQSPGIGVLIIGTTEITLTADDGNGNSSVATFDVVIADTEAPTVITQDITVSLDGTGNASIAAKDLDNASTDNCSAITFSASQTIFDCSNLGDNTVALTGTDANSNAASENATVTVVDDLAPVADVALLADVTGSCSATATAPTATDNCDGTITATTTDPTTYSAQGTYMITWTYSDASGNNSSQTQTVIVDDVTGPTIIPDVDITVSANAACEFTLLDYTSNHTTLTDDCSATITVTQSPAAGTLIVGTTAITLTADDGNGNQTDAMFFVVIDDTEAPTVFTQNITVSLDGAGNATIVADDLDNGSTDNCSAVSFSASQTTFDCSNLGDNTVALTVMDANLNSASENATVTIVDDLAPVADMAVLADVTGSCSATATAPTATDNCDGAITATTTDPTSYSIEGTYMITWTYTDASGNNSSQTQTVIVDDVTGPIIIPDVDITVSANAACEFTLLDYTSNHTTLTDDCSATITVTQSPAAGTLIVGTTAITLTADDGNGNQTDAMFFVVIDDTEAPTVFTQNITVSLDGTGNATIIADDLDNGSTDNCSAVSFSASQITFDCSNLGDNTVALTVMDANLNSASANATVTVVDDLEPVADVAVLADVTGTCSATATAPTATDNCDGTITATTTDPTTYSTEGTYMITWTYTDASGNNSSQTQTVIVDDVTGPTIIPDADITVSANAACEFTLLDYTSNHTTLTDDCSATITVTQSPAAGTLIVGTTAITLTADDGNGNQTDAMFFVVIDDTEAPTVLAQNITVSLDGTGNAVIVADDLDNGSTDNCSAVSFSAAQTTFDCSNLGDNTVALTVMDANLNWASENATVTIVDDLAPVADVAVLADVTGTCSATATAPTATDNCDGAITATTTDPIAYSVEGTYTITWTYVDGSGNTSTQNQTIIIDDTVDPVITCSGDITVTPTANCEYTLIDYSANVSTLTDNCGTVTVTQSPAIGTIVNSNTAITLTADDGNGNISTCTFNLLVEDTEAPTVICRDIEVNIEADGDVDISQSTLDDGSFDNCSALTFSTGETNFDCSELGPNTVVFTATDANGNSETCTAIVTVLDKLAPAPDVPSLNPILADCDVTITNFPTAFDNCSGAIVATTTDPLTYNVPGTYEITWTYTDASGNDSTQLQSVIINDTVDPIINCNGDITETPNANCEFTLVDYSTHVSALSDNCGTATVTQSPAIGTVINSPTLVTLTAMDDNGNTATCSFTVSVEDTEAPTVFCKNITVDIEADGDVDISQSTLDDGSFDNCSALTFTTSETNFDCSELGINTVTFTATDANGNSSTCTSTITVFDKIAPTPDVPALNIIEADCEVTVTDVPTAFDNCSGALVGTTTDPLTYNTQGTYEITWTYTDGSGNDSTQVQTVIINDQTAPVPDVATLATVTGSCDATVVNIPTATDECTGVVNGTTTDPLTYSDQGTYIVTWTYEDGNGNSIDQEQMVVIMDTEAPVADSTTLADINVSCGVEITVFPTATDACEGAVMGTTTDPLSYFSEGSFTITWSYDDGNGNISMQTQIVNVSGLPEAFETVNACNEYEFNGTVYTSSQTITEVVNNPNGCDTLYTLELIIDDYVTDDVVVEACGSYMAPSGNTVYSMSGIYTDTVPSMAGCDTVLTIDLTIIPGLPYEYDRSACGSYTAPDGSVLNSSGVYTFNVPGPAGCDSMITVNLTIIDNPNIEVAVQNDSLVSAEATSGVTYQWINCETNSIIPGATEQVFTPDTTGEYQVLLNIDGCMAISECYEVVIVGTNDLLISDRIKVYPNPFLQDVNIEFGQLLNDVEVAVFDASGKMVHQQMVINSDNYILNTDELSGGVYFLQLKSRDEIYRSKLVKFTK